MAQTRGITVLVTLVVLVSTAAGIVAWSFWSPPDPATASRGAIFRHLATEDISQSPREYQLAMVDRLEGELQGDPLGDGLSQIAERHRQVLAANAAHLKHLWFVRRTREYHELPTQRRHAFLNERIETVLAWPKLDAAFAQSPSQSDAQTSAASFFDDIERWIVEEPDENLSKQMEVVVFDGIVQWLATRDLAEQQQQVRDELALRIAEQLDAGLLVSGVGDDRPAEEVRRLRENSVLLIEAWLIQQARHYAGLAPAERPEYLDEQIHRVTEWGVLELLAQDSQSVTASSESPAATFSQLAQQCIDRARPEDERSLQRLVADVQARMLMKWLQGAAGQ